MFYSHIVPEEDYEDNVSTYFYQNIAIFFFYLFISNGVIVFVYDVSHLFIGISIGTLSLYVYVIVFNFYDMSFYLSPLV